MLNQLDPRPIINEGAESSEELNDWEVHTEQDFHYGIDDIPDSVGGGYGKY